jgi:O-methyltransferase
LSMIGHLRARSLREILLSVMEAGISGDFVETGVWRGGASMLAHAIIRAYSYVSDDMKGRKVSKQERRVFLCDSFQGLPEGRSHLHPQDTGWDNHPYMSVDAISVVRQFARFSLLDPHVVFVKGFYNVTMKALVAASSPLQPQLNSISVLRIDADIYSSTVDVLYHLYDKVAIGGYVIIDDWDGFPAKQAVLDFFQVHSIKPIIHRVDDLSVYWRKDVDIDLQYQRYEKQNFKP